MLTTLTTATLGPVRLDAPAPAPRHVVAEHGHLWQWVGDGEELISLSVAVRTTRLGTPVGVRHHLAWEVEQARITLDPVDEEPAAAEVLVMVDGATGASAADVDGTVHGLPVHNRLVVTTDGELMHVIRIAVPDHDRGREVSETVTAGLRVLPWRMPA